MKINTGKDLEHPEGHEHKHPICQATDGEIKPRKLKIPAEKPAWLYGAKDNKVVDAEPELEVDKPESESEQPES